MVGTYKVKVFTFGCQMNVYDSEQMLASLVPLGYEQTESDAEADLIIVNTCSVRDKAAKRVFSVLGRLRRHKLARPDMLLAVAGCVAQQEQENVVQRAPYVDIVLGTDHVYEFSQLVEAARRGVRPVLATRFLDGSDELFPGSRLAQRRATAFVTIMKGCNQFCSYCIVPHVRGREYSRPADSIRAEVEALLEQGVREITLLGQNVNRYGLDRPGLPPFHELLEGLHEFPDLYRLRFITSHPADCPDELLDTFSRLDKICPYFHLPLQSGSDRTLHRMNRRYTYAHYRNLVCRLRDLCPGIHISTDLIVGYPGETEEDFEATLRAAREIRWGSSFSFKYSPRPGTRAAQEPDDVPPAEKNRRLAVLQELLFSSLGESLLRYQDREVLVLVEGRSRRATAAGTQTQYFGRTDTNYVVNYDAEKVASDPTGNMVKVRVTRVHAHSLQGRPADSEEG